MLSKYRKWFLPGSVLALILLALLPGQKEWFGFDLAILPMLLGGGFITYQTLIATRPNGETSPSLPARLLSRYLVWECSLNIVY